MSVEKGDSISNHAGIRSEVYAHLEQFGAQYRSAASRIRSLLEAYQATEEGRRAVYRVASRRDYQLDRSDLKAVESAVEKIIAKREKPRPCEAVGGTAYGVWNLEDIIAFKVICGYPSDIPLVKRYLERLRFERKLEIVAPFSMQHHPSGYRAVHGVVTLPEELSIVRCEIQILTLLEEAWSYKTHDLIYKGENVIPADREDTALLSDLLRSVDGYSKIIRSRLLERSEERWSAHATLVRAHLVRILDESLLEDGEGGDDAGADEFPDFSPPLTAAEGLAKLRRLVEQEKEELLPGSICRETGRAICRAALAFDRAFRVFESDTAFEVVHAFSLVYGLGAFSSGESGPIKAACHHALRVLRHAKRYSPAEINTAYLHAGWTLYCAGDLEAAIDLMREWRDSAEAHGDPEYVEAPCNNIAYYTACLLDRDRRRSRRALPSSEWSRREKEAFTSIKLAISSASERLTGKEKEARVATFVDTRGFLRIVAARTVDEVQEGIRDCETAMGSRMAFSPRTGEVLEMYVKDHIRRGWQRLVELSEKHSQDDSPPISSDLPER